MKAVLPRGSLATLAVGLVLAACSSGPRVPDWALEAHSAQQRANEAHLSGDARVAQVEAARARREWARTGRFDSVARAELSNCAVRFASLEMLTSGRTSQPELASAPVPASAAAATTAAAPPPTGCPGFEALRQDAPDPERAYADFLLGTLDAPRIALLPASQQAAVSAGTDAGRRLTAIRAIEDPLSRLVAAAAALRDGVAPPGLAALAIDTASAQGWRRPLLAWLSLQMKRARAAGDNEAANALQRRIELVSSSGGGAGR